MFTIKLRNGGDTVDQLEIDNVIEGERDASMFPRELRAGAMGVLVYEGGVRFRTKENKTFYLSFGEFSFVL